jgi:hypothetical protein
MFGTPGIDVDDLAWIERDQFVYFMEMEHHLNDPVDWPRFRSGLVNALAAAYGWDPGDTARVAGDVSGLLDAARQVADPTRDWERFCDEVWAAVRLGRAVLAGER